MAIFRKVHTQIWSDPFFSELDSEKKIFYLYLLTNERTKQCGIYDISKKHIAFDLGISLDKVSKLISYFISKGKIQFSDSTNEVALKNWAKFNYSTSPKLVKCIESELKEVKNRVLIEYVYSIDTLSQEEEEEKEEEKEEETKKNNIVDRKLKFASTLKPFLDFYGKDLINQFYAYWTEPNKSNSKMKWEMEKTWDVKLRLDRWAKNDKNFKQNQNGNSTNNINGNFASTADAKISEYTKNVLASVGRKIDSEEPRANNEDSTFDFTEFKEV